MAVHSLSPHCRVSITCVTASLSSLLTRCAMSALLPSALELISHLISRIMLQTFCASFLTVIALSYHCLALAALAAYCLSKSLYSDSFFASVCLVVRCMELSTSVKPSSTSADTLSASMAMRTIYMRFIIFWRGEIYCLPIFSMTGNRCFFW